MVIDIFRFFFRNSTTAEIIIKNQAWINDGINYTLSNAGHFKLFLYKVFYANWTDFELDTKI